MSLATAYGNALDAVWKKQDAKALVVSYRKAVLGFDDPLTGMTGVPADWAVRYAHLRAARE